MATSGAAMPPSRPSLVSTKKKLGTNLNRLVQPAKPAVDASDQATTQNGLLLLSAAKKSAHGSGLLSGGTDGPRREEKAPDAWGTTAAAASEAPSKPADSAAPITQPPTPSETPGASTLAETTAAEAAAAAAGPRWDDYGGRGDSQDERMSRLAKERSATRQQEEEDRMREQQSRAAAKLRALDQQRAAENSEPSWDVPRSAGKLWEPEKQQRSPKLEPEDAPEDKVIHLTSYEDIDRGEAPPAAEKPRMLFDPKSGTMVAVGPAKEYTGGTGKKKHRCHRAKNKAGQPAVLLKRADTADSASRKAKKDVAAPRYKMNPRRKFPRTCGVLYAQRNDKYVSADRCEGDLGYGAHSVPGGRHKNPHAFKEYQRRQKRPAYASRDENGRYQDVYGSPFGGKQVSLYTGFNPDHHAVDEPDDTPAVMELVSANDKLELVGMDDDSPTLKPTAREWAPSQAALAAAAAAAKARGHDEATLGSSRGFITDEEEEEEEDDDGPLGLGFDPTQDMDGLMQSPTTSSPRDRLVDLNALNLDDFEPPLSGIFAAEKTPEPAPYEEKGTGPRHIFAFGTSGTWGQGHETAPKDEGTDDWGALSSGLFGKGDAFGTSGGDKSSDPTAFLNLPPGNSWGSPAGFGGIPMNGSNNAKTTGD